MNVDMARLIVVIRGEETDDIDGVLRVTEEADGWEGKSGAWFSASAGGTRMWRIGQLPAFWRVGYQLAYLPSTPNSETSAYLPSSMPSSLNPFMSIHPSRASVISPSPRSLSLTVPSSNPARKS